MSSSIIHMSVSDAYVSAAQRFFDFFTPKEHKTSRALVCDVSVYEGREKKEE